MIKNVDISKRQTIAGPSTIIQSYLYFPNDNSNFANFCCVNESHILHKQMYSPGDITKLSLKRASDVRLLRF